MVNLVNQIVEDSAIFERKFREKNYSISEKNKFVKINELAKRDSSYKNQMKLFWDFTEEKKLHEFEDWNIIHLKIRGNKEIIIENNPIFITLGKETDANHGTEIKNNHLTEGAYKSSNEIKKPNYDDNVHQEGCIQEPSNSIGSNKMKFYQPKEKLGLKNWLISIKHSISLEEESKEIYPTCLELIPEKDIIVIGSNKGEIYLLDKSQGIINKKFKKMCGKIKSLCYLNDEGSFLSGSKDGIIVRWYLDDTEPFVYRFKKQNKITSIVYTGNMESAFVSIGPNILLFNILTFQQTPNFKINLKKDISIMKWSETNLITGHVNGEINVIDYSSKAIIITYHEQVLKIKDICFLNYSDSMAIAACSKDKSVKMYSKKEKLLFKVLEVSPADIYPVRLSYCCDTKTIIVCYNNGNFFTVNYFTGKKKYHYSKESRITGCLYPGDSSSIIFGNVEGNIDIFAVK
jgi:WD40 repeat protein